MQSYIGHDEEEGTNQIFILIRLAGIPCTSQKEKIDCDWSWQSLTKKGTDFNAGSFELKLQREL